MGKQFLLICEEEAAMRVASVLRGVNMLEVEGLPMNGDDKYKVIVTPLPQPPEENPKVEPLPQAAE